MKAVVSSGSSGFWSRFRVAWFAFWCIIRRRSFVFVVLKREESGYQYDHRHSGNLQELFEMQDIIEEEIAKPAVEERRAKDQAEAWEKGGEL